MTQRALSDYIKEPEGDGYCYRLKRTKRGFYVVPFNGIWRASNGVFGVTDTTPEGAAERWVTGLPSSTAAKSEGSTPP